METLKAIWNSLAEFLVEYDTHKIAEVLREMNWQEQLRNPLAWLVGLAVLGYSIWKRELRIPVLILSFIAFMYLCQSTLPGPGEKLSLDALLEFFGGSIVLLIINGYFFFVRGK